MREDAAEDPPKKKSSEVPSKKKKKKDKDEEESPKKKKKKKKKAKAPPKKKKKKRKDEDDDEEEDPAVDPEPAAEPEVEVYDDEENDAVPDPVELTDPTVKRPFEKVPLFERDGIRYFQSPCLRTLRIGKQNEGYWDSDDFLIQVEDVLDVMEAWFPEHQILMEVDHSSGHDKFKPDGLNVNNMSAGVGGKTQRKLRTSMDLTAECLGPHPAVVKLPGATSGGRNKRKKKAEIDVKLKPGDAQPMVFQPGDPPPFEHLDWTEEQYVGKAKGINQVLFERGLWDPSIKYKVDGQSDKHGDVIPGTSTKELLANCPDFKNELNLLQQLVQDRGHILLSSPKCHPELAGDGVEYGWGQSKRYYRRNNKGTEKEMAKNQRKLVFESIGPDNLPHLRLMRYSRVAREYKLVYKSELGGAAEFSHARIERKRHANRLKRKQNTHRAIDQKILTELAAETPTPSFDDIAD